MSDVSFRISVSGSSVVHLVAPSLGVLLWLESLFSKSSQDCRDSTFIDNLAAASPQKINKFGQLHAHGPFLLGAFKMNRERNILKLCEMA